MSVTRAPVPLRVCAGVDWAKDDHAVCVLGDQGEALDRFTVAHDAAVLKALVRRLLTVGVAEVGSNVPNRSSRRCAGRADRAGDPSGSTEEPALPVRVRGQ
jgi:hypothetical protein